MQTLQLDINKKYSYADYLTWFDDVRRELFNGWLSLMSPAPSLRHQQTSTKLVQVFSNYLDYKPCQVFHAPFDVRFPKTPNAPDDEVFSVVQPDICIVCDTHKLDERGCNGAPDFIIEILSLNNAKRDISEKFKLYEQNGVKEYWIVFPLDEIVEVFILNAQNKYELKAQYDKYDKVKVNIFEDFEVDLNTVFAVKN